MPSAKKPTTKPAGTQDGGEPPEGEETEPEFVTAEQLNKAIDQRLGRFVKRTLPKALEQSVTAVLVKAGVVKPEGGEDEEDEEDEGEGAAPAVKPAKPAAKPAEGGAPPKGEGDAPAKPSPEARKLQKLQKQVEAMEAARKTEQEQARRREERAVLMEAFETAGVRKELRGPLATHLLSEDSGQLVRRNTEGGIIFLLREGEDEPDEVPVKDGLAAYFKTDEGKAYLAPRGAGGSGTTVPSPGARPPTKPSNGRQDNATLDRQLMEYVLGAVPGLDQGQ